MRIGVEACCWSNKRGAGRFARELLKAIISIDSQNEYLFFVNKDMAMTQKFPEKVKIVPVSTNVSPAKAASSSGRRSLRDLWVMSREVLKHDIDIFFFPTVYLYFPILNRARVIITVYDTIPYLFPDLIFPNRKLNIFWKIKQYIASRQAHLILTISEYSKQQIIKHLKISEPNIRLVSGAPGKTFRPLSRGKEMVEILGCYQLDFKQRFLLYVGGISPHKNLENLIEAYHKLIQSPCYSDVKLIIIGDYQGDSFYSSYPVLKEQIEKLGLGNRVIFTGYIPDNELVCFYNAASLLVFPSLHEGFGLPAIEAMACGTPVAASNAGALPEIIGEAGRFFDPNNPSHMSNVIKDILSDDVLKEKMVRLGLMRAKQFSWDKAAKDTLSILEDLVSHKKD